MSTKGCLTLTLVLAGVILGGLGCGYHLSPAQSLADEAAVKISQGNRTDAEALLRQAVAEDPKLAWAHYNLGSCLAARRAFDDAVASYQRALQLFDRKDRHARSAGLYGIAVALDDKNDFGPAIAAYEAYLQFADAAPEESNGVTQAKARLTALKLAQSQGLPPGKPLRAVLAPASAPAPAPPPEAAPAPPAPPAPVVAPPPPEPVKAEPEKPAAKKKARKGKKGHHRKAP
jgi:tetratricopeptide (TPR) repeat protein